ncbi:MAG: cell envelope biogenesis protein TolA [Bauldia sp.]|nr:cell envelope biogenesis protein TolA [Bauldia sp.]
MAKASSRKLKVFRTQIGFHELAVATGSRAAALRAFGARQDLFALGLASETEEADVVAATTAHPDVVLKRPVGSDLPFGTEAARPRIADIDPGGLDPPPAASRPATAEAPPRKEKPRPDRAKLTAAEERLAALGEEHRQAVAEAEAALERLRAEERRIRAAVTAAEAEGRSRQNEWRERLERAAEAVERERRSYRRAGGEA